MSTPTFNQFEFDSDYRIGYAETDDPRVLAIIERDDADLSLADLFDGDAINPIYTREYGRSDLVFAGGYDDDTVAKAWTRAYQHLGYDDNAADRFVRIFHGATVAHTSGGYRPDFEVIVFDTPDYREHIGDTPDNVSQDAADDTADEVRRALDGGVYGIGYAVSATRTTTETPIDLDDPDQAWELTIECWGLIGDEYAASEAIAFAYGDPRDELTPLLF